MGRFEVIVKTDAEKDLKRLQKKYPHISDDLAPILEELETNPLLGDSMEGFGEFYKTRVKSTDMRKGKRGGFRVITCPKVEERKVDIWLVFSVSEADDPGTTEIRKEIERRIAQEQQRLEQEQEE